MLNEDRRRCPATSLVDIILHKKCFLFFFFSHSVNLNKLTDSPVFFLLISMHFYLTSFLKIFWKLVIHQVLNKCCFFFFLSLKLKSFFHFIEIYEFFRIPDSVDCVSCNADLIFSCDNYTKSIQINPHKIFYRLNIKQNKEWKLEYRVILFLFNSPFYVILKFMKVFVPRGNSWMNCFMNSNKTFPDFIRCNYK